ncbi:MAG: N-glycosylase/DNA lyase [bacterium]|nr:N-glycosylase/DNA lyase [bacterium]
MKGLTPEVLNLVLDYEEKKSEIRKRLEEFKEVWKQPDKQIFSELCFCLCTPQAKAIYCGRAISSLEKKEVLFKGNASQIRKGLNAIRFPNNKTRYIMEARKLFTVNGIIRIKNKIDENNIFETRQWFVRNVKGFGFKEASHFLRNIGFGDDFAILDVHILRSMMRYGIIDKQPKTITKNQYLCLENELRQFSQKANVPMDEIDLLFWASETGKIFK